MFEILAFSLFVFAALCREYAYYLEKKQLMAERSELLNRIKPETAQLAWGETPEMIDNVQTDAEYWDAHEKRIKDEGTFPYGGEEEAVGR